MFTAAAHAEGTRILGITRTHTHTHSHSRRTRRTTHDTRTHVARHNTRVAGMSVSGDPNPGQGSFIRSDSWVFHKAGIPSIYPWTGKHFVGRPSDYAATRKYVACACYVSCVVLLTRVCAVVCVCMCVCVCVRGVRAWYVKTKYHGPGDEYDPRWSLAGALQQGRVALRLAYALATSTRPLNVDADELINLGNLASAVPPPPLCPLLSFLLLTLVCRVCVCRVVSYRCVCACSSECVCWNANNCLNC
jgi:hypothetical protein